MLVGLCTRAAVDTRGPCSADGSVMRFSFSRLARIPTLIVLVLAATGQEAPAGGANHTPLPTNYAGNEPCPAYSEGFRPLPGTRQCDVITFAGAVAPGAMAIGKNAWWQEGLQQFANHINMQGGLRLGEHAIGYVKVNVTTVEEDDTKDFVDLYKKLCDDNSVSFLLAPLPSRNAQFVREQVTCKGKIYVAADAFQGLNQFPNLFSVYNVHLNWGNVAIDVLYELGARTFAIAGKKDDPDQQTVEQLKKAIYNRSDTKLFHIDGSADLVAVGQDATLLDHVDKLIKNQPDVFIGLGDTDTFTTLLKHFFQVHYAPKCAFFIQGLAVTKELADDSYTRETSDQHVVYDQWMGTISWSKDMHYNGRCTWEGVQDPYGDSNPQNITGGCDRRCVFQNIMWESDVDIWCILLHL